MLTPDWNDHRNYYKSIYLKQKQYLFMILDRSKYLPVQGHPVMIQKFDYYQPTQSISFQNQTHTFQNRPINHQPSDNPQNKFYSAHTIDETNPRSSPLIMISHNDSNLSVRPKIQHLQPQLQDHHLISNLLNHSTLKTKYSLPGDIDLAKQHAKTKHFGVITNQKCSCCNEPIKERFSSLTEDLDQRIKNNQRIRGLIAVTFFFKFIIYLIVMMLIRFLIVDFYNIYTSVAFRSQCEGTTCESGTYKQSIAGWLGADTSLYHKFKQIHLILIVNFLSFLTVIALIIYSKIYRGYIYNKNIELDEGIINQNDYAVFITGIPIVNTEDRNRYFPSKQISSIFQQKIRGWVSQIDRNEIPESLEECENQQEKLQFIHSQIGDNGCEIVKNVNLCYDINSLLRIEKLKRVIIEKLEQKMDKNEANQRQLSLSKEIIDELNYYETKIGINFSKGARQNENMSLFTANFLGSAFVSFKYEHYKDYVINNFKTDRQDYKIKGQQVDIYEASHPADVRWQNLTVSEEVRKKRVTFGKYIMFCVLFVSFILLGLFHTLSAHLNQIKASQNLSTSLKTLIIVTGPLISFILSLINTALTTISQKMVQWEKHFNSTNHFKSHLGKVVASHLINTGSGMFIASIFLASQAQELIEKNGLVFRVLSFLVVDSLKKILFEIIGVRRIKQKIGNLLFGDRQRNSQKHGNRFQITVNEEMEDENFDLVERYSYYINNTFLVSFVAYFAPICVPCAAFIFFLMYWRDKTFLFKNNSFNYQLSYDFTRYAISISQLSIFFYSLGIILFSFYKAEGDEDFMFPVHPLNIIGAIMAAFFALVSFIWYEKFDKWTFGCFLKKERINRCPYDERPFGRIYQTMNPASKSKYLHSF